MLVPFTSSLLTHTRTHTHTCTSKTTPPFQSLVHEIFLCRCCPFLHSSLMRAGASVIMLMCPEALHSLSIYHESFVFHSTVAGALWHERKLEQERVCVCVCVWEREGNIVWSSSFSEVAHPLRTLISSLLAVRSRALSLNCNLLHPARSLRHTPVNCCREQLWQLAGNKIHPNGPNRLQVDR